jgi:hypothetical protein
MFNPMGSSNPQDLGNGGTLDGDVVITGDLSISGGVSLTLSEVLEGTSTIDVTSTEALLVRKNGDGGDIFIVDTTNSRVGVGVTPTHTIHAVSTDNKGFFLYKNLGNNADNLDEFSAYYSLSILNRNGGSYLNFGGDSSRTDIQATDGAGSATAKNIALNPFGGNVSVGGSSATDLLDLRTDPANTNQPGVGTTGADSHNAIRISSTGNVVNEKIGIAFGGYSGYSHGGMYGVGDSTSGSTTGDITFDLRSATSDANFSEVMRITHEGAVGIGQDTPTALRLHLQSGDGANSTNYVQIIKNMDSTDGQSMGLFIQSGNGSSDYPLRIKSRADTDLFNVLGNGNVGIGVASPSTAKLEVHGGDWNSSLLVKGSGASSGIVFQDSGGTTDGYIYATGGGIGFLDDDSHWAIQCQTDSSTTFYINNIARMVIDTNSSISLSNNDSNTGNTVFGYSAFNTSSDNASDNNTVFGHNAMGTGTVAGALGNVAIGHNVLEDITSGDYNTALGFNAGASLNTGGYNVLIGYNSGDALTSSAGNVFVGISAGSACVDTANAVLIGNGAGEDADIASDGTIAIGYQALKPLTSGIENVAIGYESGLNTTDGRSNVYLGYQAGKGASGTESFNTGIGKIALTGLTTGQSNVGIGANAGYQITTSSNNVLLGVNSGKSITTQAGGVVAVGHDSLQALTSGLRNTAMGYLSAQQLETGSDNTAIGYASMGSSDGDVGSSYNTFLGAYSGNGSWAGGDIDRNTGVGYYALGTGAINGASLNTAVGNLALTDITTGVSNSALGSEAGANITIGRYNVAIGVNTLITEDVGDGTTAVGTGAGGYQNSDSDNEATGNSLFGYLAGEFNVTGTNNTYIGYESGRGALNQSNSSNTAVGFESLKAITTGNSNTAVGMASGDALTTGGQNVAIGIYALSTSQDIDYAVAIGFGALNNLATSDADGTVAIGSASQSFVTSGQKNVSVGFETLRNNVVGDNNTAIGYQALETFAADTDGHGNNTAVGHNAMQGNVTGTDNTVIGNQAGFSATNNMTAGDNNTLIGSKSTPNSSTPTNETVIGYNAVGQADNSVTLGNSSVTAVYMAQDSGATVHAGNVISNSNHAVEGYATGRNVIRSIRLNITPGDSPGTNVSIDHDATAGRSFNTPSLTDGANITNNTSNGSFALNDGSTRINVDVSNAIGMLSESVLVHDLNSSSTSAGEIYFSNTVIDSNDLSVALFKTGSQSLVDWRTVLAAGDSMTILITYMASS